MRSCLYTAALAALLFISVCHAFANARLGSTGVGGCTLAGSRKKSSIRRREVQNQSLTYAPIDSPYHNVFLPLSDTEAAGITKFLHNQPILNLTDAQNATSWENIILNVETLPPNKSAALPYLNGEIAEPPKRYAKASIKFGATDQPYIEEYLIGPLPLDANTSWKPFTFIYNKNSPIQRVYNADDHEVGQFIERLGADIAPILRDLLSGADGGGNDTLDAWKVDPLWKENGDIVAWYQYFRKPTTGFDSDTLLPQGLYFKLNITGRDPNGWGVMGWYYDGIFYGSTEAFQSAWKSGRVAHLPYETDGAWGSTDWNGEELPLDQFKPPVATMPDNPRYGLNADHKYIEWMDFSFFLSFTRDTGLALYDIRFKGDRVIYELGMQEALAHYASSDPYQSGTAYLDSYYGFGTNAIELISGYDCPSYATYLNTSFFTRDEARWHPNSICLFEFQRDSPIQRHSASRYVSVTKNIMFVVRSVSTIGNYDYQFTYEFYLDGSIQVLVRASGYIQSAFWAHNGEYGFKIHDALSCSMHDHVLNYKLDLDVHGTANSLMKTEFVPVTETYPWFNGTRNTMKLKKTFITSEADSKLHWLPNHAGVYSVVNKDAPNAHGEYPGWKIVPTTGSSIHLTPVNSTTLARSAAWATHPLYAVQHRDSEPRSAHALSALDPAAPLVDFARFFDDAGSLTQQDIVLYFNLGMHHAPDVGDLPNTVSTLAQSGLTIAPQNYLVAGGASRASRQQVRVKIADDGSGERTEVVWSGGGGASNLTAAAQEGE